MSDASQVVVLSWAMIAAQAAGPLGAVMVLPMSCARLIAVLLQHQWCQLGARRVVLRCLGYNGPIWGAISLLSEAGERARLPKTEKFSGVVRASAAAISYPLHKTGWG